LLSVDSTAPVSSPTDIAGAEVIVDDDKKELTDTEVKTETAEEIAAKAAAEVKDDVVVTDPVVKPAIKNDPAKRISKLTKNWRTAERSRDAEKARREAAEKELRELKATIPTSEKPNREDFEDDIEFIEALTDWKVEDKLRIAQVEKTTSANNEDTQQTAATVGQEIDDVLERGRDKYDDYDELVFAEELVLQQDVIETILTSDIPEELFYYLGQNPEIASELGEMSAFKAAKEIGKIEADLLVTIPKPNVSTEGDIPADVVTDTSKVTVVKHKKLSKAPAPIEPIKTGDSLEEDPNQMSTKEYRRWRERVKE